MEEALMRPLVHQTCAKIDYARTHPYDIESNPAQSDLWQMDRILAKAEKALKGLLAYKVKVGLWDSALSDALDSSISSD